MEATETRAIRNRGFRGRRVDQRETTSIAEQVETFAAASWMAGPVGSGLCNTIFSPPDVRRIVLDLGNFQTGADVVVAREHGPLYIFGRPRETDPQDAMRADWDLHPRHLRFALDRTVGAK